MLRPIRSLSLFLFLLASQFALLTAETPSAETQSTETQSTETASDDTGRTYVVTASRDSEDAMAAPASVSVITAADIAASGKTSLVQVLEDVPGVSFRSYSGEANAQVSMRGFGENSFGRVVVLIDGKRLNNPDMAGLNWLSIPVGSIERIEVLDGPSAVLYGSGAVGGVINVITKEKANGVTANAEIGYGSFDTRRTLINGGYGTDSAGFLISADIYRTDGYRDRSANKNTNVTLLGFFDLTDKLTLKPSFTFSDIAYQLPGALTKAQFDDDPIQAVNDNDDGTERDMGGALTALFTFSDNLLIEMPVSYLHKKRQADMASSSFSPYTDRYQHQLEAKPKFTFKRDAGAGNLRVVAGLDYEGVFYNGQSFSDEARTTKVSDFDVSQWACAPYLSGTLNLPRNVAATAGVRYNYASFKASKTNAIIAKGPDVYGDLDESDSYQAIVYDLAVNYHPVESLTVYVKYNTLFRYPFIDEKAELSGFWVDRINTALKPETGWNGEIGAKYRLKDFATADFNVYCLRMKDEIAYTTSNVNLDATDRLGGMLAVSLTPLEALELQANAAYVHAVFAAGANKGETISFVPALTGGAGAKVKLPAGVTFGADVAYIGKTSYWSVYTPTVKERFSAYWLLGVNAGFAPKAFDGKLAVKLRVENVLDVKYPSMFYSNAYYPGMGRAINVSVAYAY